MTKLWNEEQIGNLSNMIIVLTDSSREISKYIIRLLAQKQAHIIVAEQSSKLSRQWLEQLQFHHPKSTITREQLDLSDLESIKALCKKLNQTIPAIDILINNASTNRLNNSMKTKNGFEIHMGANHLGHFALTGQLLPLLKNSSQGRIVVTTSVSHKKSRLELFDLNWRFRTYNKSRAYCDSRFANLLFGFYLAEELESTGSNIVVTLAHSGWTEIKSNKLRLYRYLRNFFAPTAKKGAQSILRAAFDQNAISKDYFGPSKFFELFGAPEKIHNHIFTHNFMNSEILWKQSIKLTGVDFE